MNERENCCQMKWMTVCSTKKHWECSFYEKSDYSENCRFYAGRNDLQFQCCSDAAILHALKTRCNECEGRQLK